MGEVTTYPTAFPHRRPTSHRKQQPMPVWQAICLSVTAAGVLLVFAFGLIALLAVTFT